MADQDRAALERSVRRLQQKLDRAEINLRRLEDQREGSAVLHATVIKELERSQRQMEEKNAQLEALTRRLEHSLSDLLATQEQLALSERLATQASRAKSTFLANMSHELRTPLNAIIGYAELLEEILVENAPSSGVQELERIHQSGRHLLHLIDQILDLSKIEAGRMALDLSTVELSILTASLAATIGPAVQRKGLTLRIETVGVGTLWTDEQKLTQILLNLLSNAVKFTEQGVVELSIQQTEEQCLFVVRDTGVGMTAEQQSRIFLPFEQADPSTTRRYGGTGLGLAIAERFCALLGGRLSVDSAPRCGTTFTLMLPI